ncbi:membrane protein [Beggiatoa sp. PS]|nr:membrane protein [Beggiatoa sp. PS]
MEIIILKQILFLTLILLPLFYIVYKVRNNSLFDLFGFILVITAYVLIHHKFVFGHQYAFHDTLWTYHVFFSVIDQWIREGFSIGWNPFMNGGEPLYLYSNIFLWAELFLISFINKLIFNLPSEQLVNLFFTYLFLSYFTFSFILFSAIFRKSTIVFFSFTVLVFSGITQTTMAIPSLIYLHLTPLVFLSLYLFFRKKDIHYLFFSFFLICLSANHYVPHYIAIAAVFFTVSWYLSQFIASKFILNKPVDVVTPPKANKRYLILILLASIIVALPVLYSYSETTAYISPTRGGKLGEVTDFTKGDGLQQSVFHPLHRYKYLLDMPVDFAYLSNSLTHGLEYHHSVSYIGYIAIFFFLLAFVVRKKGIDKIILSSFIVTLAVLVYFSLKNNFLWLFLSQNIPLFILRHAFPLANITTLLIIIISTFGFMYAIKSQKMRYATIAITLILSAYPVIKYAQYQNVLPIHLAEFEYPYERSLYSQQITPIAFDTTPLILKQAAATHHYEDFILFRKDEYDNLLKTRPDATVGHLFSFAPTLSDQVTIERPTKITIEHLIGNDPFGLSETNNIDKLVYKVHYFQNGSNGKATKNTELEGIKNGVFSLLISPSSEGNSFIRYTFNETEQLVGKTIRFSIWVKSDNKTPNAVQVDIQSNAIKKPVMLVSYQNSQDWEQLIVEKEITKQDDSVYLTLNVKNNASSIAYFDHIEIDLSHFEISNIPLKYIQDNNPNHLRLEAVIPQDGYLIRKENFHAGWSAKVNNIETPIEKYADVFQAVKVNQGKVVVDFEFKSLYPLLLWLHIVFVFIGYFIFFYYLIRHSHKMLFD